MYISNTVRKGFSLIELLIVIFIVALIYFLGFGTFSLSSNKKTTITPLKLKSAIQQSKEFPPKGRLICINQCKTCFFKNEIDAPAFKLDIPLKLGNDISIYQLDKDNSLRKVDFGRFMDNKICLLMDFYQNGSSTQMVLENLDGVYFLGAYFDKSKKVNSLEDAKELWLQYEKALHNQGDFY